MFRKKHQETLVQEKLGCLGLEQPDDIFDDLQLDDIACGKSCNSLALSDDMSSFPNSAGVKEAEDDGPKPKEHDIVIAKVGSKIAKGVVKGAFKGALKGVKYSVIKGIKIGVGYDDSYEFDESREQKTKKEKKVEEKPKVDEPLEKEAEPVKSWEKHLKFGKEKGKRMKKVKKVSKVFKRLKKVRLFKRRKNNEYNKFKSPTKFSRM